MSDFYSNISSHPSEPFQIDRDEKHFCDVDFFLIVAAAFFVGCCDDASRIPNIKQQNAFCLCVKISVDRRFGWLGGRLERVDEF